MTHTGIECFLAICRHKTASAAANALYITQPSLSARLKSLEQQVGTQLFYRCKGSREMTLTQAGREFYELAKQYEALIGKMKKLGQPNTSTLRIACFSSLDTYLLPAVYRHFLQENPQYSLQTSDLGPTPGGQSVLQGSADLAFTTEAIFTNQLMRVPVFTEPMVLVCATDSPLQGTVTPSDLPPQKEIFVAWNLAFSGWHRKTFGYSRPHLRVSTMMQLRQFLEQEKGWAIVPISVAQGLTATGSVRQLETDIPFPRREVAYVVSAQQPVPALHAFQTCLRQVLSQHPEFEVLL